MPSDIIINLSDVKLLGQLEIPRNSNQLVIFVHGSGSSRLSPRNRYVAEALNKQGFATCLFDLLTAQEESIDERTRELRFNIPLLSQRLLKVTHWLIKKYESFNFNIGYFGASTGAAAALVASTQCHQVQAIVSRGGRPDLADTALKTVTAATLLIVGARDEEVIKLNKNAFEQLQVEKELAIVPNATHLFEELGTLDDVIELAIDWFRAHLASNHPEQ